MGNPVVHFEISSKDFEKSQAFYCDLFAWNISKAEGMPYFMVQGEGPNRSAARQSCRRRRFPESAVLRFSRTLME